MTAYKDPQLSRLVFYPLLLHDNVVLFFFFFLVVVFCVRIAYH